MLPAIGFGVFVAADWSLVAQQPKSSAMLAVTRAGGLYRSADGGKTWQPVLTGSAIGGGTYYSDLATDPSDPLVLLVSRTAQRNAKSIYRDVTQDHKALYRSLDGGKTWSQSELPTYVGLQLLIDSNRRSTVYLMADDGIYRSLDSGQNWTLAASVISRGSLPGRALAVDPSQPGVVYAALPASLMKSADYGAAWSTIATPSGLFWNSMAVDPKNSNTLFLAGFGTCTPIAGTSECGSFRSLDGGKSWERVPIPGRVANVVFDARNGMIYAAGRLSNSTAANEPGRAMFHRSADAGKTWTSVTVEPGAKSDLEVSLDPVDPAVLYARVTTNITSPNEVLSPLYYVSGNQGSTWTKGQISAQNVGASDSIQALRAALSGAGSTDPGVTHVSAASFQPGPLAPGSIATAIGTGLASSTASATSNTTFSLGGARITITDVSGRRAPAPLFFVSPRQINYLVPPEVAVGAGSVTVERDGASALTQPMQFAEIVPGIFTLNANRLAAATVLRVSGMVQSSENVYTVDAGGAVVARPIDLQPSTDEVYLLLFGSGFRLAAAGKTTVTIGGQNAEVLYSGPQGSFAGLDQINVRIPPALAGRGAVELRAVINGLDANATTVTIR